MKKLRFLAPLSMLAVLAACAPQPTYVGPTQPQPRPEPVRPAPPPPHKPPRTGSHGNGSQAEAPSRPHAPPAVLALMKDAESSAASGSYDNAASSLERAIRIQPRSAELWQKLAEVRLQQHQPGLAEDLAKKSNVLAKGNKALIHKNWAIIAEARRQKGDAEGAAEADAKAGR